jgi:TonB family protein
LGRSVSPPGSDQIKYADGKKGFISSSFLEGPIATPGWGVTPPKPTYKPEPGYTPEAQRDHIEGTVVLTIIIDWRGDVVDVKERSAPLGDGLDQMAMDTVKTWKFNPAMRDGMPVSVRVSVEVGFRLYRNSP